MSFKIGATTIGNDLPLNIIAGPCQLESSEHSLMIAQFMADACAKVGAGYIFKGSFDKALSNDPLKIYPAPTLAHASAMNWAIIRECSELSN